MKALRVTLGASVAVTAILIGGACAASGSVTAPSPEAISLPTPGLRPVFSYDSLLSPGARDSERHRCIDDELTRRDLNEFGERKGTVYADGAPFGVKSTVDRYRYVLNHQRGIATRCTLAPGEPGF